VVKWIDDRARMLNYSILDGVMAC